MKSQVSHDFKFPTPSETQGLTNLLDFENFKNNIGPYYQESGEIAPGVPVQDDQTQVYNDLATSFTILLAIFFPSVTGNHQLLK